MVSKAEIPISNPPQTWVQQVLPSDCSLAAGPDGAGHLLQLFNIHGSLHGTPTSQSAQILIQVSNTRSRQHHSPQSICDDIRHVMARRGGLA
jgi:hypothetical protein